MRPLWQTKRTRRKNLPRERRRNVGHWQCETRVFEAYDWSPIKGMVWVTRTGRITLIKNKTIVLFTTCPVRFHPIQITPTHTRGEWGVKCRNPFEKSSPPPQRVDVRNFEPPKVGTHNRLLTPSIWHRVQNASAVITKTNAPTFDTPLVFWFVWKSMC